MLPLGCAQQAQAARTLGPGQGSHAPPLGPIWLACDGNRQLELVGTIGRPANQDEPPIAVTAIDVPVLTDSEEHARMLGPGAIPVLGCAVTHHSVAANPNDFRQGDHADPSSGTRTVVVQETIFPLPLHRAEVALNQAKRLAEKRSRTEAESRELAALLDRVRQEIRFGQALGYGAEGEMQQLLAEVDQIDARTSDRKSGRGLFDRIDGMFDKARQSSQSPRGES